MDVKNSSDVGYIVEVVGLLLPVATAFLAGYYVDRVRSRQDAIAKFCEEICNEIEEKQELAAEYWANDQIALTGKAQLLATKILARQRRISQLKMTLEEFLSEPSKKELIEAEQAFYRSCTGGQFGVHNRLADLDRSASTYFSAASFIVAVRSSHLRDKKGWWRRT